MSDQSWNQTSNQTSNRTSYRVGVFCSANDHLEPAFLEGAAQFAEGLAQRGWELIYGGAQGGLMGHFATHAVRAGGVVRGAVTEGLGATKEIPHQGIQELLIVKDLFARKKWFMDQSDAFVVFPGGFGTLDEALEVITWKSLNCIDAPIVFVNLNGFWQRQIEVFQEMSARGVIRARGLELYDVCDTVEETFRILEQRSDPGYSGQDFSGEVLKKA